MSDARDQRPVLFGAAYYHEYQPTPRLEDDLDLMAKANFSVIRVGEATWAKWQPAVDTFDVDWLAPVLDAAADRGIRVVIGTPTFAVPQWLVRRHPEIALRDAAGNPRQFGRREEHNLDHPVVRYHAQRVIERIVARYADHPAVIGWQVHNEPGFLLNHSHDAFEGFKDHLRARYRDVETLNREWGLTFWSHDLSTWDDLWAPGGNGQPQYDLAWRQYQATLTENFLTWQRDLVKKGARDDQFVTTCLALNRMGLDEGRIGAELDIASANLYYRMQDGFTSPGASSGGPSWLTTAPWGLAQSSDRSYAIGQAPFLVFETNGGAIGGAADNLPAYDGQWRQAAWQMIARGARMVEYWHWQSLHYGTETFWGGVLPHDQQPGRVFEQIAALGAEIADASPYLTDLTPDADVAVLWSVPSKWGLSYQPHRSDDGLRDPHGARNEQSYLEIVDPFYQAAFEAGHQVRVLHDRHLVDGHRVLVPAADVARDHPVLVVPALYIASDALLDWLVAYAEAGGHLVLGPKSAFADTEARPRRERKPARLSEAAGVWFQEYSTLTAPLPVEATGSTLELGPDAVARDWLDCLVPAGAEVLAAPVHPHFSRFAAVTSNEAGAGRITVVGGVPSVPLARAVLAYAASPDTGWTGGHSSVSHSSATRGDGSRMHWVFNWSWEPRQITVPTDCARLDGAPVRTGDTVDLGPWDVLLLSQPA